MKSICYSSQIMNERGALELYFLYTVQSIVSGISETKADFCKTESCLSLPAVIKLEIFFSVCEQPHALKPHLKRHTHLP